MSGHAIELDGVSKSFKVFHRRNSTLKETLLRRGRSEHELVQVLKDVSFTIETGQALGIIGRNGAGKSTLLKVICGLMTPDAGEVTVRGRVSTLLELGAGFQGEYSGRENVYLYAALMGLNRRYIEERFDEIVEFSGIDNYIDNAVKTYSSGMYARLAFAVAVHVDPDILVVDEVLAVGDEAFQRKCFERVLDLRERGKTIVLVSHDLETVRRVCDRAIWIDAGVVQVDGKPQDVAQVYVDTVLRGTAKHDIAEPAAVRDIEVLSADSRPTDAIRTGDSATVAFTVESREAIGSCHAVVRWVGESGVIVASASTLARGPFRLPAGASAYRCEFQGLPLVPGSYRIEVTVAEADGSRLVHPNHDTVLVSVLGSPVEGVAAVKSHWVVGAAASDVAGNPGRS